MNDYNGNIINSFGVCYQNEWEM